ncbi:hypothetical protein Taro_004241 [Colocasia esculenta]|uniref:VPS37 C-terminal domain-containing protein n=1 Tax=Colocasia esculenta TaxID=4460 RepID=A0A843TPK8_COLES|nr:hypothetical protein [Colocasia esculenta]
MQRGYADSYQSSMASLPSNTSRLSTPGSSSSFNLAEKTSRPQSPSLGQPSPAEATGIISRLKDKSLDELSAILTSRDKYANFFHSLDEVKVQNYFSCADISPVHSQLGEELRKETLQLARENLDKEPRILELKNQCQIIRATELAAAQEKLQELVRQQEATTRFYSLPSFLQRLQEAANKADEESDALQRQLLETEIDLASFVQKYKKLRTIHHVRALTQLAARTTVI